MKQIFKKGIAITLAALLLLTAAPLAGFVGLEQAAQAAEVIISGNCGTNVTYVLDSDGQLSIAGKGDMKDYLSYSFVPWDANRDSIKKVVIEGGVMSIGEYAFSKCSSLTSVTIPDSVTSIGDMAFSYCKSLTSVTIGNSVTSVGDNAFYNCTSLASITILDSVTNIGDNAFGYCTSLGEIVILNPDCSIYDNSSTIYSSAVIRGYDNSTAQAYAEKYNLSFVSLTGSDDDIILSGYAGENANFTIIRDGTMAITGTGAMYDYNGSDCPWHKYAGIIKSVSLVDGIASLGDCAFYQCSQLSNITIPDSVKSIGDYAFYGCRLLNVLTIPNSVKDIGNHAFYKCTSLTSVTIPDSVTSFGSSVFSNCTSLTSVTIGNNITSIGYLAFYKCTSLTLVNIPDSVKTIEDGAFSSCSSLISIIIPNRVTSIKDGAFDNCSSLTSVSIPYSVKDIEDNAFYNCTSLTAITILNPSCSIYDSGSTIPSTATIYGYEGSTAKSYARKYNRSFEILSCAHENTMVIPAVPATCTATGLSAGIKCALCQTVVRQPKVTPVTGHTDVNTDNWCDTCGQALSQAVEQLGDTDGDEQITSSDARLALRASVGLETLTDAQRAAADTDGNGEITSSDARAILRAAVGLDNPEDWIANIK